MQLNPGQPRLIQDSGMAPQPMMPKPGMMNDSGMAPGLGVLAGRHPAFADLGAQAPGGGLMRLLNMYGRPQGGGFHRGAY